MKITYISHATLLIETAGKKIVTDPWVTGSAYCDQWHLFPKPVAPHLIRDADFVLYSHGHEDHLHCESLQTVNRRAKLFYPYSWFGGTTEFFNELGFPEVKEVLNGHTVRLDEHSKVTYLANNLDTVIVIESEGKVIVNVNDALPSASPQVIETFLKKINARWPRIDYVFASYGGASYFPNTVHYEKKDDIEIAEARELFFINNFCRIVQVLDPTYAIPFATDFVLLDDHQRWINRSKFPRENISAFYKEYTKGSSGVQIVEAYPGDYFEDGIFQKTSVYHTRKAGGDLLDSLDIDYREEIERKLNLPATNAAELSALFLKVQKHILAKAYIIPKETRRKIKFAIRIRDGVGENILNIDFRNDDIVFKAAQKPAEDIDLLIDLRAGTLNYTLGKEWGGDAIIIGYGAEIYIYNEASVVEEYENYCVRLLTRYPNTREHLKREPLRALRYLFSDAAKRANVVNKGIGRNNKVIAFSDPVLFNRDLWLNKSKCEVCKACNI